MRGHPGTHMAPGPTGRAFVRRKKPPRIILCVIGTVTCLLFCGAAAMLAVGYQNPFGTIGLSILGVGAVLFFGAIVFLVLMCLWVEKKYPGVQPLSFRLPPRRPRPVPPTSLENAHVSGQHPSVPPGVLPSYRIHSDYLPYIIGFKDSPAIVPSAPEDPEQMNQQNDVNLPEPGENTDNQQTDTDDTQITQESSPGASPVKDRKAHRKIHHVEVPSDDSCSTDSSAARNKKVASQAAQKLKQKNRPTPDIGKNIQSTSTETSSPKTKRSEGKANGNSSEATKQHGDNSKDVPSASPPTTRKYAAQQKSPSPERKGRSHDQKNQDVYHGGSHSPSEVRKHTPAGHSRDIHASPDRSPVRNFTDPALAPSSRRHSDALQNKDMDVVPNTSPMSVRKMLQLQKDQALINTRGNRSPSPSPKLERKLALVERDRRASKDNNAPYDKWTESSSSSTSTKMHVAHHVSPSNRRKDVLHYNHDASSTNALPASAKRNSEEQSHHTSRRVHFTPPGSPTQARKTGSPERIQRVRRDQRAAHTPGARSQSADSPPSARRDVASSPPRHRHRSPDIPHIQQHSRSPTASPPTARRDMLHKRHSYDYQHHSAVSSQSSDISSSPSTSPLTAKKLLQFRNDQARHFRPPEAVPPIDYTSDSESSGARRTHPPEAPRSPRSRVRGPGDAEASPPTNKKSSPQHRKDQR